MENPGKFHLINQLEFLLRRFNEKLNALKQADPEQLQYIPARELTNNKVRISTQDGFEIIDATQIIHCKKYDKDIIIYCKEDKVVVGKNMNLSCLEQKLKHYLYFKAYRLNSDLINLVYVKKLIRLKVGENGYYNYTIIMENESQIKLPRIKVKEFEKALDKVFPK